MFDAIVLAGAGSRRLDGADKASIEIGTQRLLDRVVDATKGADRVIVVGPRRAGAPDVRWVEEDPPGRGPVAALSAGLAELQSQWCLVLATDLPWVAPAVPLLLTAAADVDVAVLTDGGRRNYLAAVWHSEALRAAVERLDRLDGAAMRELFDGVEVVDVGDEADWSTDVDTWDDVEQARAKATDG
jgi:molybdopterin-guanine dinucleotide biosynthesis protein A